jgi:lysozyme
MKRLRLLVPVLSIAALLVLLMAPVGASAAPLTTAAGSGCTDWYTVRRGDTLGNIAWKYGTTAWGLQSLNGLRNPNRIYPGQVLCVNTGPAHHHGFWYRVECGDTLGDIGWRYGHSAAYLARANGLWNADRIYPGQRLWIP